MSTATMLDLQHDAQMLDYAVQDVAMQSSTSSWFPPEDVMEEDRHFSPEKNHFTLDTDFSVEVEMETYADQNNETAEYEMSDDGLVDNNELLDVEVTDASHLHTPVVHDISLSTDTEYAPVTVEHDMSFAEPVVEDDTRPLESYIEEVTEDSSHNLYPAEEDILQEGKAPHEELQPFTLQDNVEQAQEDAPSFVESAQTSEQLPSVVEGEQPDRHVSQAHDGLPHVAQEEPVPTFEEAPEVNQEKEAEAVPPAEETEETKTNDPHEISEGVYIDPPPAVLLSVSSLEDVCLFNLPARSGATTPRRSESPEPALLVLLHQLPTLYYEPLSKVFEALRHEEYISRISGLPDCELTLDAYDLQLVVSEDNVYAREISLHDLNLLHDGSDLPGPLRLRLQTVTPRFILRYHLLQDQITRLNLEAAEQHEDIPVVEDHNEKQEYEQSHKQFEDSAPPPPTTNDDDPEEYPELPEEEEEAYAEHEEVAYPEDSAEAEEQVDDLDQSEPQGEPAEEPDDEESKHDLTYTDPSTPRVPDSALTPDDSKAIGNGGADSEHLSGEGPVPDEQQTDSNLASTSKTLIEQPTETGEAVASASYEDDEVWDDTLDAEGDPDLTWEEVDDDDQETASNESVATLSSKTSKRSFHDLEPNGDEVAQPDSPGTKRARIE